MSTNPLINWKMASPSFGDMRDNSGRRAEISWTRSLAKTGSSFDTTNLGNAWDVVDISLVWSLIRNALPGDQRT